MMKSLKSAMAALALLGFAAAAMAGGMLGMPKAGVMFGVGDVKSDEGKDLYDGGIFLFGMSADLPLGSFITLGFEFEGREADFSPGYFGLDSRDVRDSDMSVSSAGVKGSILVHFAPSLFLDPYVKGAISATRTDTDVVIRESSDDRWGARKFHDVYRYKGSDDTYTASVEGGFELKVLENLSLILGAEYYCDVEDSEINDWRIRAEIDFIGGTIPLFGGVWGWYDIDGEVVFAGARLGIHF